MYIIYKFAYPFSADSIDIQIATMSKSDRANIDEGYVCGFIPKYLLSSKMPWPLDPFLHPLIVEIEDLFIDGMYTHIVH